MTIINEDEGDEDENENEDENEDEENESNQNTNNEKKENTSDEIERIQNGILEAYISMEEDITKTPRELLSAGEFTDFCKINKISIPGDFNPLEDKPYVYFEDTSQGFHSFSDFNTHQYGYWKNYTNVKPINTKQNLVFDPNFNILVNQTLQIAILKNKNLVIISPKTLNTFMGYNLITIHYKKLFKYLKDKKVNYIKLKKWTKFSITPTKKSISKNILSNLLLEKQPKKENEKEKETKKETGE